MKQKVGFLLGIIISLTILILGGFFSVDSIELNASPNISSDVDQWAITYGGTDNDHIRHMITTSDGGYLVAGLTESFGLGSTDIWIIKLYADGNVNWENTYGGANQELVEDIFETSDNGFIVVGSTSSFGEGDIDIWILKLSNDGNIQWQNTYGGIDDDRAYSILELSNGDFFVIGTTQSEGPGERATLVMNLNSEGSINWQRIYAGNSYDDAYKLLGTSDGGVIVIGDTDSFGMGINAWMMKLNLDGTIVWQNTYQVGSAQDEFLSIQETVDGGFIAAGFTNSVGAGLHDALVMKLNSDGSIVWQKTYGGLGIDLALSVVETLDSKYLIAGRTDSFGMGQSDAWLLKLNSDGNIGWEKTYGGIDEEDFASVLETSKGSLVAAGYTDTFGPERANFWILKLGNNGEITGCNQVDDSDAMVHDTFATIITTTFDTEFSNLIENTSSVIPMVSNASASLVCIFPPPTPTPTPLSVYLPSIQNGAPVLTPTPTQQTGNIVITNVFYDGSGSSEPDEYVEIENIGSTPIQLQGWMLTDNENHVYLFPNFLIQPGQICRIYTNQVWPQWCGFSFWSSTEIWDNGSDCATLNDALNQTIDQHCY